MSSLHHLHLANPAALQRARSAAQPDDVLLLREDAVVLAMQTAAAFAPFATVFALAADVDARGMHGRLPASITLIDDAGFVALCLQHARTIAWC